MTLNTGVVFVFAGIGIKPDHHPVAEGCVWLIGMQGALNAASATELFCERDFSVSCGLNANKIRTYPRLELELHYIPRVCLRIVWKECERAI